MSVKKKVDSSLAKFIDKGADVKADEGATFKNVLIRMPIGMLDEIDFWIEKRPWLNRTQVIVEAVYEKLMNEEVL